ncbi:hypothetical protein [Winogradskyella immobilis]|uniref:Cyclin N-terminal domain-containing protein n=1 Tax=Winogradskyella immobilis TaxID=2816852 RepID=A0ABS8EN02_9FLAO|nr:hypothetical protein [Winogradskyella immobilis]MCC1483687.1 hypothetical protein [Winogradskyella immobilis]MCG0015781.1 hypothetical protein [Winogradskyella immobilis]
MEEHFYISDIDFLQQFKDCKLDPKLFSHEAHLRLAWLMISNYGKDKASKQIQEQLKKFVVFVGARDKYNATLTVAAVYITHHFMQKSKSSNFKDFIIEFPRLKTSFKALIESHYSFDVFNLETAKAAYLQPDVLPFDTI